MDMFLQRRLLDASLGASFRAAHYFVRRASWGFPCSQDVGIRCILAALDGAKMHRMAGQYGSVMPERMRYAINHIIRCVRPHTPF